MSVILKINQDGKWNNLAVLTGSNMTVGRISGNDVVVENDTVSRQHLRLIRLEDLFFCVDLNSTNGTIVNEVQLDPFYPYQLFSGDIIIIGAVPLKFIDQAGDYSTNRLSLLTIDFSLKKAVSFTNSVRLEDPLLPNFEITEDSGGFLVTTQKDFRVLLSSSCEILGPNVFKISNPGCLRIDDLFVIASGPRQETQATTEAKLPVLLKSDLERLVQSRKDQGTIVVQYIDSQSRGIRKRPDYLPKSVFEPSNFFTLELVLWVIIIVSILLTGMLLIWYYF